MSPTKPILQTKASGCNRFLKLTNMLLKFRMTVSDHLCGAVNGMWPSKQGLLSTRPTTSTGHKPKAWELIGMWFHSHLSLSSTLLTLLFQPKLKIINWDHNRNKEKKEQAKQFSIKHQHLLIILSVFYWLAPHIYVSFQTPTAPPNQPLMDDPIVFHD